MWTSPRNTASTATDKPLSATSNWPAWLTVERMAYGVILVVAFALRFAGLGQQPLTPGEAEQAWSALAMLRGEMQFPAAGVSPLLLSLHWFTFGLTRAGETLARLWPALAGTALVLLPYGLRRELGRSGALFASLLLALSASLGFWSRSAIGESFTLLATLGLVVCLAGLRREGLDRWIGWTAATLALLLMSSPAGYLALLLLLPLAVLWLRDQVRQGSWQAQRQNSLRKAGLILLALLVLGPTAFWLNPGGLAALADLPATFLGQFARSAGYSWGWLWLQFLISEPLLVAAGLVGLAIGLRRRERLAQGLGFWLLLDWLLSALRSGRTPFDTALAALPLALLGGQALAAYGERLDLAQWRADAVALLAGGTAILVTVAIWLADYAGSGSGRPQSVFLLSAVGTLVLLLAVIASYALMFDGKLALQIGLALLLIALLMPGLRKTMLLTQNHDGLRWGSLLHTVGATDGRNLPAYLDRLASQQGGDLRDLSVGLIVAPGADVPALLRWYLRDTDVQLTAGGASEETAVLVSMADSQPSAADRYAGRSFRLTQSWSPQGLAGGRFWRWLVFGRFDTLDDQERAVVWLRLSE